MANLWARDAIQFPRLLAEISAVGLTSAQYAALAESMDLDREEIDQLLDRADAAWTRHKQRVLPARGRFA